MTYRETYDEQLQRVRWTLDQLNDKALRHIDVPIIADLSCGDGMILRGLSKINSGVSQVRVKTYGDIMWGPHIDVLGPIEETIKTTVMDMLICTQTIELLADPTAFLRLVRDRTRYTAFTTPLSDPWNVDQFKMMLESASLMPRQFAILESVQRVLQLWVVQSVKHITW